MLTHQRKRLMCQLLGLAGAALPGCTKFASELDGMTASELQAGVEQDTSQDWSCLASEAGNPVTPNDGPPLDYTLQGLDFISGRVPKNLRARACFRGDVACAHPATEFVPADARGYVTVPLNVGFSGYLEVLSDDMVPTLLLFPAPLDAELATAVASEPVALLGFDALAAFGAASNVELADEAGVLSLTAYDCKGPGAAGVRLELNAPALPFTFVDGLPIPFNDTTEDEGTGGFANVLPGLVIVRGYRADTMELVGLETVLIRSRWVTVTMLMPQYAAAP